MDKGLVDITWKEVKVGMLVLIRNEEHIPADMIALACATEHNVCFVQTTNLDGETNLKQRQPAQSSSTDANNKFNQVLKTIEP